MRANFVDIYLNLSQYVMCILIINFLHIYFFKKNVIRIFKLITLIKHILIIIFKCNLSVGLVFKLYNKKLKKGINF